MQRESVIDALFATEVLDSQSNVGKTLPIHAGEFLQELEQLFGPRDLSFTLLGIEISKTPEVLPHLWYPPSGVVSGSAGVRYRQVVIRLGNAALYDETRAKWQLAHECLHLLDPWLGATTNWLEEGLAHWYQNTRVPEAEHHDYLYKQAEALVVPLIGSLPAAIKDIRLNQGLRIGDVTYEVLLPYFPEVGEDILRKLCERWKNNSSP